MRINTVTLLSSALLMTGGILAVSIFGAKPALACSDGETYIGSICSFGANWCPKNYLPADGKEITISSNPALYAVIGDKFGGTPNTTFKLPDLRGRAPAGIGYTMFNQPIEMGTTRGTQTVTLTESSLPKHAHIAKVPEGTLGEAALSIASNAATADAPPTGGYLANPPYDSFIESTNSTDTAPIAGGPSEVYVKSDAAVGTTGSGQAIPIESPYTVMNFCIRVTGLFPPRD